MSSVWTQTVNRPKFPPLEGDLNTDVLIVGGGIAGLLCAHRLRQAGADCVLLEARELCGGATGNTTAKITIQHGLIYDRLLRTFGVEKARLYLKANLAALEQYRALCRNIDCDFEEQDSYVYSLNRRDKLEREIRALSEIGFPAEYVPDPVLPVQAAGAVRFRRQAQFHPLKFLFAIAEGLPIHEHTKVLELKPSGAKTHRGTVRAKHIIVSIYDMLTFVCREQHPVVDEHKVRKLYDRASQGQQGSTDNLLIGGEDAEKNHGEKAEKVADDYQRIGPAEQLANGDTQHLSIGSGNQPCDASCQPDEGENGGARLRFDKADTLQGCTEATDPCGHVVRQNTQVKGTTERVRVEELRDVLG